MKPCGFRRGHRADARCSNGCCGHRPDTPCTCGCARSRRLTPGAGRGVAAIALVLVLAGCAGRHAASGLVLRVDRPGQSVVVSHREIPGVMPAMTMPLRVHTAAEMEGLQPGDQIDFKLHLSKKASSIRSIRRRATLGEGLTDGMALQPPAERVALRARLPEFALRDQAGELLRSSDLDGAVVAFNFIYTRCPLPEVCPRLASHFARLQRRFAGRPVRFVTVTLDPQYDTVAVLGDYAKKWRADRRQWQLVTGAKADVDKLAAQLGMLYWPESGQLTHTSVTSVIDRQGRLAARIEGSSYEAGQLGDLIEGLLAGGT